VNRQTKRLLQRQGQLAPDGTALPRQAQSTASSAARRQPQNTGEGRGHRFVEYLREVRVELSKVLWPKRPDVINYSTVVLGTLILLASMIFVLNLVFAKGVLYLFTGHA
jgi:preprotein translocase subunit SecE